MLRRFAVNPVRVLPLIATQSRGVKVSDVARNEVITALAARKDFAEETIQNCVKEWFAFEFDSTYMNLSNKDIANHIHGYMCAKAQHADTGSLTYSLEKGDSAFYIGSSDEADQFRCTSLIDTFLAQRADMANTHSVSMRSYHAGTSNVGVVLYTINYYPFVDPTGNGKELGQLTSEVFMKEKSAAAKKRYQTILAQLENSIKPVFTVSALPNSERVAINMAFRADRSGYLTSLLTLITAVPGVSVHKKFVETFSNNTHVYSIYVSGATEEQLTAAASRITLLPNRPNHILTTLYAQRAISEDECIYGHSVAMFAHYFTAPTANDDFTELYRHLKTNEALAKRLKKMRNENFQEMMSESAICEMLADNLGLFKELFANFSAGPTEQNCNALEKKIIDQLGRTAPHECNLFRTFLRFNRHVVRSNFFKADKAAVAYRMDPGFIADLDFPAVPYGLYIILGGQFRGFHVRFHDIARGGVRMIRSSSAAVYKRNKRTLFHENYNLAYTQMLKNKDIPESGSKGTMLVSTRWDSKREQDLEKMFLQYVDALLDCMLEEGTRGTLKSKELLFLGPDEGTAGLYPTRAALYARERNFEQWKSLTTGKLSSLGGIPHDVDGMTTYSVRQYVNGIYRKLHLDGAKLSKFVTGGPDGDLGSNEIKQGIEKIVAMCDGSGSIYHPDGIDREELLRLAKLRAPLKDFDRSKVKPESGGFIVLTTDKGKTLPDGTIINDGEQFRNEFHLSKYVRADTFVPCGGRPASVTLENVARFISDAPGGLTGEMMFEGNVQGINTENLKFRFIVEGANLFITQDARIALENCGVILFKDSSANKGGVTSSSVEVFTGLALSDAEHKELMCCEEGKPQPAFYAQLVRDIMERIADNANREFEAIWEGALKGHCGGKRTFISDRLSSKIVEIYEFILGSTLHEDDRLFRFVIGKYTPKTLLDKVSLDEILTRVPRNYLNAIFCRSIANEFVFTVGAESNEFAFFQFMRNMLKEAGEN